MPPREEKTTGTKPNPWEAQPAACLAVLLACDWRKRVCEELAALARWEGTKGVPTVASSLVCVGVML